jgi:hypothetical protein
LNSGGVLKHDNAYLRGRVCIESVRGVNFMGVLSFSILSFSVSFVWFAVFRAFCWHGGFPFF